MPILTDQERIGTLLGERYRIDAILGRGGMGVVFRAHEVETGQAVAVKILRPELAQSDPQFAKRFLREARAAAAIRHTNVVEVLDLGEEPDGTIYQVLQLLVGASLREHLERKDKLDLAMTLELLLPVMHALEAAHAAGIVHRDLKPDNIFLARQPSGEAKPTLLDFGIAKLLDTRGGSFATNTGSIMGTPAYMAPEQAGGYKDQGPAIDIWAMGIIAYECLSGSPPFSGSSPAHVMLKIMTETPPAIDTVVTSVPSAVSRVIEKALARTPAERHQGMAAFREALRAAASAEGIALPAEGRASTTRVMSIAPPADDEDVARAATDAAADADDTSEGVATMSARLRQERVERMRADAQTQLATKRANDSIEVAIDMPVASTSRRIGLIAGTVVTVVLGIGIGVALYGGDTPAPSTPATSVATTEPPATVPQTHAPPPSSSLVATTSTPPPTTSVPSTITPPLTTPPATTVRGPRGGRGPREGSGTSMASTSMVDEPTMVAPTMETATTMMGGLPSVVGWEDE
ncbi:MAG: serine/threonine protein kinase [Deltaproteobacteria bacterium]|nr:serine/threonine protein kinase [Deltaproteobacteria bacterium]